jgi:hypothetical protein
MTDSSRMTEGRERKNLWLQYLLQQIYCLRRQVLRRVHPTDVESAPWESASWPPSAS